MLGGYKKLLEIAGMSGKYRNFELRSKILTLEKTQEKLGFLLAKSYLCTVQT